MSTVLVPRTWWGNDAISPPLYIYVVPLATIQHATRPPVLLLRLNCFVHRWLVPPVLAQLLQLAKQSSIPAPSCRSASRSCAQPKDTSPRLGMLECGLLGLLHHRT